MDRRRFLKLGIKGAVIAMSPLDTIINLILNGAAGKSFAATTGVSRYLMIHQPYAPSRWMFDLLLNPFNAGNFKSNAQMGTSLKGATSDRYDSAQYVLQDLGGIYVPPMWGFNLPSSATGVTRQLSSLIPNMFHLRGINTNNPDHETSKEYLFLPMRSVSRSVPALAAEQSADPIPAIALHPSLLPGRINTYEYKSGSGTSAVMLKSANYIKELTEAFTWPARNDPAASSQFAEAAKKLMKEIEQFQGDIDKELAGENSQYDMVLGNRREMRRLLSSGLGDPIADWTRLVGKYAAIIRATLTNKTFPGISDRIVGAAAGRGISHNIQGAVASEADLRTLFDPTTVTVRGLAELFAASEYIFDKNLSSSIVGNHEHIAGITNASYSGIDPDQHTTGSFATTFLNTMMFSSLGACLLEFVEFLKSKGLFDSTLIEIASEFNRTPKSADGGADHAQRAASTIFFSGSIKGPIIAGNIAQEDTSGTYRGATYGNGVDNPELGGGPLTPSHRVSTIAAMLDVSSPTPAGKPAAKRERDGKIVIATGAVQGKIIPV